MNYSLVKNVIDLVQEFEAENRSNLASEIDIECFKRWIATNYSSEHSTSEPNWTGKAQGRSAESVINTLIVHMNRYAKNYAKSAIFGSDFSSQEDFIYLINLKAFGEMTKMELIKKNVHEKPVGIQIINRLIGQQWVKQTDSQTDKRSKVLKITQKGITALANQMDKIREASQLVTGNLTHNEKMELIRLLNKLNEFHRPIYDQNIDSAHLLEVVLKSRN